MDEMRQFLQNLLTAEASTWCNCPDFWCVSAHCPLPVSKLLSFINCDINPSRKPTLLIHIFLRYFLQLTKRLFELYHLGRFCISSLWLLFYHKFLKSTDLSYCPLPLLSIWCNIASVQETELKQCKEQHYPSPTTKSWKSPFLFLERFIRGHIYANISLYNDFPCTYM